MFEAHVTIGKMNARLGMWKIQASKISIVKNKFKEECVVFDANSKNCHSTTYSLGLSAVGWLVIEGTTNRGSVIFESMTFQIGHPVARLLQIKKARSNSLCVKS